MYSWTLIPSTFLEQISFYKCYFCSHIWILILNGALINQYCYRNNYLSQVFQKSKNFINISKIFILKSDDRNKARISKDMDRTLYAYFAYFKTTWDFPTKISALLQLSKIWLLIKFEGCSSKIGPATPIGSFLRFWREI